MAWGGRAVCVAHCALSVVGQSGSQSVVLEAAAAGRLEGLSPVADPLLEAARRRPCEPRIIDFYNS